MWSKKKEGKKKKKRDVDVISASLLKKSFTVYTRARTSSCVIAIRRQKEKEHVRFRRPRVRDERQSARDDVFFFFWKTKWVRHGSSSSSETKKKRRRKERDDDDDVDEDER